MFFRIDESFASSECRIFRHFSLGEFFDLEWQNIRHLEFPPAAYVPSFFRDLVSECKTPLNGNARRRTRAARCMAAISSLLARHDCWESCLSISNLRL